MTRFLPIILVLFSGISLNAQDCTGIIDTIFVCNFQYNVDLQNADGSFELTCPNTDAHIAIEQGGTNLDVLVNQCGEYTITHAYMNTVLNCLIEDVYVLQFDDPSNQQINIQSDLVVTYGDQDTHTGGSADCDNPTEITIDGVDPPVIEWEQCYLFTSQSVGYFAEVTAPIPALECEVEEIILGVIDGIPSSFSDCGGFLQDDFYGVAGFDFLDLVNPSFSNEVSDWLTNVIDIPGLGCSFDDNMNNPEIDTIIQGNTYYIPIRVGGNWAIIQNGNSELLEDTTNLTLQMDPNYIFIVQPAADYIGPEDITFELLYLNGLDTVPTPVSQNLTLQWEEFWDYDTLTIIDTIYQTASMACGGLFINQPSLTIPGAPPSPFGPIGLDFPAGCDCEDIQVYEEYVISCDGWDACISAGGSSDQGDVIVEFDGFGTDFLCGMPSGTYPFTVTSVTTGCQETGFSVIDEAAPSPIFAYGGIITCDEPCVEIGVDTGGGGYAGCVWTTPDNQVLQDPNIEVCVPGTYIVTVFDFNGCETTEVVEVTEATTLPFVGIENTGNGNLELTCAEPCITFFAFSDVPPNCTWTLPDGTAIEAQSIEVCEAGVYNVVVTDETNGCTAIEFITITADFAAPDAGTISEIAPANCITEFPMCEWNGASFLAIEWFGPNGNSLGSSTQIQPTEEGTYTVIVTDLNNGCTATTSAEVEANENTNLNPQITGQTEFCAGDNPIISVEDDFIDYQWNTGENTPSIVGYNGFCSVTVTDANGCTGEASIQLTELPEPIPIAIGATTFCEGSSTTISIVNENGIPFQGCQWSNGEQGNTIQISEGGTFCVFAFDINGCQAETCIEITESSSLAPVISGNAQFCEGESTTLDAGSGFTSYLWNTGETTQTTTVDFSTTCVVTVTDASGCTGTNELFVEEVPSFQINAEGGELTCVTPCVQIDINSIEPNLSYVITGPFGYYSEDLNDCIQSGGEYTILATNVNGCTATTIIMIYEDTNIPISAITETASENCGEFGVCVAVLSGCNCTTQWLDSSGNIVGNAMQFSPNEAGEYTLLVTNNANGCTAVSTVEIAPLPDPSTLPTAAISGNLSFCEGSNTTLSAANEYASYLWSTGDTSANIAVSNAGAYSLLITDENGCTAETTVEVEEAEAPVLTELVGGTLDCNNTEVYLNPNADETLTYQWSGPDGFTSTQANPLITEGGTYQVELLTENACSVEAEVFVSEDTFLPELTLELSNDISCENPTAIINIINWVFVDVANAELWYQDEIIATTGAIGVAGGTSLTVEEGGEYILVSYANNGCMNSQTITVESNTEIPEISLSTDTLSCCNPEGLIMAFSDMENVAYEWQGPNGFISDEANINVYEPGNYLLTVTTEGNCSISETIEVVGVFGTTPLNAYTTGVINCQETSVQIGIAEEGDMDYFWLGPDGFSSTESNPIVTQAGSYVANIIDSNCCQTTVSVEVESDIDEPIFSVPNYTISCQETAIIANAESSIENLEYEWSSSNGFASNDANPSISEEGIYNLLITNTANGCSNNTSFQVNQIAPIELFSTTEAACEGSEAGSMNLNILGGGIAPYTIEWQDIASTEFSVQNLPTGDYTYEISDSGDCIEIGVLTIPAIPATIYSEREEVELCPEDELLLEPSSNYDLLENAQFEWQNGSSFINQLVANEGTYTVQISQDCEIFEHTYDVIEIDDNSQKIYIPNAFSPNDDGINDTFLPLPVSELQDYSLMVFDRWGNLIFENENTEIGWDGKLSNNKMDNGLFIYHLRANVLDCKGDLVPVERYGDVSVVR